MKGNLVPEHLQELLQNSPAQPPSLSVSISWVLGMAGFHILIQHVEILRHSPDNNSPEASELLLHQSWADPLALTPAHAVRVPAHTPREGAVL